MGCGCNSNFGGTIEFAGEEEFSNFNLQDVINKDIESADKDRLLFILKSIEKNLKKRIYEDDEVPFFKKSIEKIQGKLKKLSEEEEEEKEEEKEEKEEEEETEEVIKKSFLLKNQKAIAITIGVGVVVFLGLKIYKKYKK